MPSLLTGLGLCCLVVAAGMAARWATERHDALGRPREFPVWSVTVLVVVALVASIPGARRRMEEHRLASVATRLVGHAVSVHCQSNAAAFVDAGSELGYVLFDDDGVPEPRTTIKRDQCRDLRHYLSSDKHRPTEAEVVAVHVLTHESMHMRGETDESVAECEAVQRDALTARMLGASLEDAARLAKLYWRVVYPFMPADYVTLECRPGARLDEGLASAPWL